MQVVLKFSGWTIQNICFSVDCGPPGNPHNGSLESYTDTTEGSEVFYSCDPGLVPEGRMRAVCTEDGWSPNPAYLNCTEHTSSKNSVLTFCGVLAKDQARYLTGANPSFYMCWVQDKSK